MARHSLAVSLPPFRLTSVPIEVAVHQNGEHIGFLFVSQGSIDWRDRNRRTTTGVSWSDLRDFLTDHGTRRIRPRVVGSGRARARGQARRADA